MPKVTIDNIEIDVPEGTTILQAARMIGERNKADRYVVPPAMCYTTDEDLIASRNAVVEFLLINHPLDCPICDQAGECHLQDLSYENGKESCRYQFERRTFDLIDIGDKIKLHMTRCILCYRCVKVADQLTDGRVHGVINRGDVAEISTYISNVVDNDFSGNMIDVCPVGALTDRTFRFASRVWFTKPMDAHRDCDKCSGKVVVWYKGEEILRVTGRKDQWGEVEEFICNTCRFEKKKTSDWTIEGPRKIDRHSVISQGHYDKKLQQKLLASAAPDAPDVEPFDFNKR
jgi:NADH-quinone oxidoreductase subunit G